MNERISRRDFLKQTSTLAGAAATTCIFTPRARAAQSANEKVTVGVMGCNGRGMAHIAGFLSVPNTEIAYVCDVDSRAIEKGLAAVAKRQSRAPKGEKDVRRMLEDPNLDAISIATPNHWHAPATILACAAGKHVYVEKPGSHNLRESALMVEAGEKHRRVVQMGNQRRSWPWVREAMAALHAGEIGKLFFARTWYTNHRGSIGQGKAVPVPEWLDYTLWQGPAPDRPYRSNLVHYNWHWFWHWGSGELGNNGVHSLDLARWGLQVDLPTRVTCGGNRYHFKDDQETPDVYVATFDFGDKGISWDGQSCDPRGFEGARFGVSFYGEKGSLAIAGDKCRIYDLNDKLIREIEGKGDDVLHFANFVEAIRSGQPLNAPIAEGQKSTILCHLGNIAWRTGRTINFDPKSKTIMDDRRAAAFSSRDYRSGWQPKV